MQMYNMLASSLASLKKEKIQICNPDKTLEQNVLFCKSSNSIKLIRSNKARFESVPAVGIMSCEANLWSMIKFCGQREALPQSAAEKR